MTTSSADNTGLPTTAKRPRLSLGLIGRDNEGTIDPCLESIRPWVDEIIVVDTGLLDKLAAEALQDGLGKVGSVPGSDRGESP